MSYSGLGKALMVSVFLSACAHGSTQPTASNTAAPATHVETGGKRQTDGPSFTRLRSAYLASGETRPQYTTGGQVVVEHNNCNVWSSDPSEQCDLSQVANSSITPGYSGQ
jgi:hypothetical protein